jgi:hypothetical protein
MTKILILMCTVLIVSTPAYADAWQEDLSCGNAQIHVQISEQEKGINIWDVKVEAKSRFSKKPALSLYFEQVYFNHRCQKTKSGKDYYVFQAYCSGSACHDKDSWGIIDDNAKLILSPYKSNRKWKEEILNTN